MLLKLAIPFTLFAGAFLANVPPVVTAPGFDWEKALLTYGPLGIFCLYFIVRGEKILEKSTRDNVAAIQENTKAVRDMKDTLAERSIVELLRISRSPMSDEQREHLEEHIQKFKDLKGHDS